MYMSERKRFIRDSLLTSIAMVFYGIFMFGSPLILTRFLSVENFGTYSLIFSIIAMAMIFSDLRLGDGIVKLLSEYGTKKDIESQKTLLNISFKIKIILGFSVTVILIVIAPLISISYDNTDLTFPLQAFALYLPFISIRDFLIASYRGLETYKKIVYLRFIELIVTFSLFIFLVPSYGLIGAIISYIGGIAFTLIIISILSFEILSSSIKSKKFNKKIFHRLIYFGKFTAISAGLSTIFYKIDIILVGYFLDMEDVAHYAAAQTIVLGIPFVFAGLGMTLIPKFTALSIKDKNIMKKMVKTVTLYTVIISSLIVMLIVVFAPQIISIIYPPDYKSSAEILRILIFMGLFNLWAITFLPTLYAFDRPKTATKIHFFIVLTEIPLCLILIPSFGVIGAAFSSVIAQMIGLIVGAAVIYKLLFR
jgi:O-antigen/teichoic acid export membrane protein